MPDETPEDIIGNWCEFHLDETVSRWPAGGWMHEGVPAHPSGLVYAGEGIVAALKKAGYKIVKT